jgi:hypothetical protein
MGETAMADCGSCIWAKGGTYEGLMCYRHPNQPISCAAYREAECGLYRAKDAAVPAISADISEARVAQLEAWTAQLSMDFVEQRERQRCDSCANMTGDGHWGLNVSDTPPEMVCHVLPHVAIPCKALGGYCGAWTAQP